MKKIIFIVYGTRPELIKCAPIIFELKKTSRFKPILCCTGQHQDLLKSINIDFGIRPDLELGHHQGLSNFLNQTIIKIETALKKYKPDFVLAQGDTSSALCAALAAYHAKIPFAHIEAGLRSHDLSAPFPEEGYRKIISSITSIHFAPTRIAKQNLIREGQSPQNVFVTGNPVIDALQLIFKKIKPNLQRAREFDDVVKHSHLFLVTAHRRENHGRGILEICRAIKRMVQKYPKAIIFFPAHPNPNVSKIVKRELKKISRVRVLQPLDYLTFITLVQKSFLILSDSGGIQEEARYLGKKLLILREKTERPECLKKGVIELVEPTTNKILSAVGRVLKSKRRLSGKERLVFGNGQAAKKIVRILWKTRSGL